MDKINYKELKKIVSSIDSKNKKVVDVGSKDFNGSCRDLFPNSTYIGVDVQSGNNVDVVMSNEFEIPLLHEHADIVVCTSVLEHCRNPFILMSEMVRILKPFGYIIIAVPQKWGLHDFPHDYWRINPDGLRELFMISNIREQNIWTHNQITIRHGILKMTYGVGIK